MLHVRPRGGIDPLGCACLRSPDAGESRALKPPEHIIWVLTAKDLRSSPCPAPPERCSSARDARGRTRISKGKEQLRRRPSHPLSIIKCRADERGGCNVNGGSGQMSGVCEDVLVADSYLPTAAAALNTGLEAAHSAAAPPVDGGIKWTAVKAAETALPAGYRVAWEADTP
ncbi:hypothetical protein XENOCAPTIV_005410 [Xenoophorus captivus]|uniref:Uncharacterized protein n=1 Tax=Xenoophorus captivus TaxID=1517983 RepID=A0ABV0QQ36_9TELE